MSDSQRNEAILQRRQQKLDKAEKAILRLEQYLKEHPGALPARKGDLILSERLVNRGDEVTIRIVSYGPPNAAFLVTHNCFGRDAVCEPYLLDLKQEGEMFCQDIKMHFDIPGNTKLELWVNGEKIIRQVAVIEKGYMAVIPWIGANTPPVDEELHRYGIAGDFWMPDAGCEEEPRSTVDKYYRFVKNSHQYGDRVACFVDAKTLIPDSETDSLFELDFETQDRGIRQLERQMRILGFDGMELLASYTPDGTTVKILEELGVKGLTSLCAWQNWQDGGWKINHCGVSNQPYFPAEDDFRRAGGKRKIMCFTMGTTSCSRNYSIMAYDGCPTNIVPGERYFDHRVLHYNAQRFYDIFDGYIADARNNEKLLTITVAIESFRGFMDWGAVNDMAIRYMARKAETEKIVFTSAADVSEYHQRHNLDLQEAYYFQPDYYYGYHNGELPGRIPDRIEAVTPEYLAVVRRGDGLPLYFYDYTKPWDGTLFEEAERNEFGLINPDTHAPSESLPRQVNREDITIESEICGNQVRIRVDSRTAKERMVTGVFDLPFEADFEATAEKKDVKIKKVTDHWTGNTHLFVDLGCLDAGRTEIVIAISGKPRTPVAAESMKEYFAVMWFGDHGYLRCMDKDLAIRVEMEAPEGAYILLHSGEKIAAANGRLAFTVNEEWFNEAPMVIGYGREAFEQALGNAVIRVIGPTKCSRWSGQ